jgi:snRNA-activating protein complex subunit 3
MEGMANETQAAPKKKSKIQISSLSMEQVRMDQLTLRINEPYWMLHQGNCEHIFTIDEIRSA